MLRRLSAAFWIASVGAVLLALLANESKQKPLQFYQHVPGSSCWTWGLVWGHATSVDLVNWCHQPPALTPSPGHFDQDGCFSGCATLDGQGRPVLLYTGVRRKPCAPQLAPSSLTVSEMCEEVQLMATARDPGNPYLVDWDKVQTPLITHPGLPPGHLPLNCWRDPFMVEQPISSGPGAPGGCWRLLVGSGVQQLPLCSPSTPASRRNALGVAWVYRSPRLEPGTWELEGCLCSAQDPQLEGPVWECPVLVKLPRLTSGTDSPSAPQSATAVNSTSCCASGDVWLFSVSVGTCPSLYWLGQYSGGKFDLVNSLGPLPLDAGDVLYAPNVLKDGQGRVLLWGWLMELPHRPPPSNSQPPDNTPAAATTAASHNVPAAGPHAAGTVATATSGTSASAAPATVAAAGAAATATQSGSISLPRVLTWMHSIHTTTTTSSNRVAGDTGTSCNSSGYRLHQAPLPELLQLQGPVQEAAYIQLAAGERRWVCKGVPTAHCLMQCTIRPQPVSTSHSSSSSRSTADTTASVTPPGASAASPQLSGSSSAIAMLLPAVGPRGGVAGQVGRATGDEHGSSPGDDVLLWYDHAGAQLHVQVGPGLDMELSQDAAARDSPAELPGASVAAADDVGAADGLSAARAFVMQLFQAPYSTLELTVFIDGSLVEVFTGDGQVLSTRAYRGGDAAAGDTARTTGVFLAVKQHSRGSPAVAGCCPEVGEVACNLAEMCSMWGS